MGASSKTKNYGLPVFLPDDPTAWSDYNKSMQIIDTELALLNAQTGGSSSPDLSAQVSANKNSITVLQNRADSLEETQQTQGNTIRSHSDLIGKIQIRSDDHGNQILDLMADVSGLDSRVDALEDSQGSGSGADAEVAELKTRMTAAETDIDALQTDVGNLDTKTAELQTDVSGLETATDGLENSVSALQTEAENLKTNQTALSGNVGTLTDAVGNLESNLESISSTTQSNKSELNNISYRAEGIQITNWIFSLNGRSIVPSSNYPPSITLRSINGIIIAGNFSSTMLLSLENNYTYDEEVDAKITFILRNKPLYLTNLTGKAIALKINKSDSEYSVAIGYIMSTATNNLNIYFKYPSNTAAISIGMMTNYF